MNVTWCCVLAGVVLAVGGGVPCLPAGPDVDGVLAGGADPAIIAAPAGQKGYYVFATGRGLPICYSPDLVRWTRVARVFRTSVPSWAARAIPGSRGIWAPDLSYFAGRYHLYYSVSTFGSQRSVIGLAVNKTINPSDPEYTWEDRGLVLESHPHKDDFNAIDPALFVDTDGKAWLFWGSYWTGIKVAPVDKATGKLANRARIRPVASRGRGNRNTAIEGAYVIRRGTWYYLFVSWDFCLAGAESTYKVMVGRAKKVTGPYVDLQGRRMIDGGGTLVLASHGRWAGPGHNSVLHVGPRWWMAHHTYDTKNLRAHRVLQIRPMYWTASGWPVVGQPVSAAPAPKTRPAPVGTWRHWVDYANPQTIELLADHTVRGGKGRWARDGRNVVLRWPSAEAPGGAWLDRVILEPPGRSYVGRNQNGQVIFGQKQ